MSVAELAAVTRALIGRAQRQSFVVPSDIREELGRAGLPEKHWKAVLAAAKPLLRCRHGRYYYTSPATLRLRLRVRQESRDVRQVQRTVRRLIRHYRRAALQGDQRAHERVPFVQPVRLIAADGRRWNFISQDLSLSGMRLIGSTSLIGQKVRVQLPRPEGGAWQFSLLILWASPMGDGLVQQGGTFVGSAAGVTRDGAESQPTISRGLA